MNNGPAYKVISGLKYTFVVYKWLHTPQTKEEVWLCIEIGYTKNIIAPTPLASRDFQVQLVCKCMRRSICTYHMFQALGDIIGQSVAPTLLNINVLPNCANSHTYKMNNVETSYA